MGLRERVAALAGTLADEPRPDGGFRLSAMLPVTVGSPA
jgi:signal transduction histidine kinase